MKRIAIVDENKCKPEKCKRECIGSCPPQKSGKSVIEIEDIGKNNLTITNKKQIAKIIETNCIGCNLCVKKCPFQAIKIVNLPDELPSEMVHRYSQNGFALYKLPIIKHNVVTGFVGQNGVGKTTLIDILSNSIIPNFGNMNEIIETKNISAKFRGTTLQNYFNKLYKCELTMSIKEQRIKKCIKNEQDLLVSEFINSLHLNINEWYYKLEINLINEKKIDVLSGGELQRLLCWVTASKEADVYIFDEPTNFLDIRQRLEVSKLIVSLKNINKYVFVIEHDLSILDYIADELYILYGKPSVYGIVSKPLTPLEGINIYLDGYIPIENIRFRDEEFNLKYISEISENLTLSNDYCIDYIEDAIKYDNYELLIPNGSVSKTSLNVILGENGTGKTTFVNWISQSLGLVCSIKPQNIDISIYKNTDNTFKIVYDIIYEIIGQKINNPQFQIDVIKQLGINNLLKRRINTLSGGELQRVMIAICLGKDADIYLLDEPSANLDIENRLNVIKTIKKFMANNKCCFIVEHDIMMTVSLAQEQYSSIILISKHYQTVDNIECIKKICKITKPLNFNEGINEFMNSLDITMRISTHNRPRINKYGSRLDKEQKKIGNYYN